MRFRSMAGGACGSLLVFVLASCSTTAASELVPRTSAASVSTETFTVTPDTPTSVLASVITTPFSTPGMSSQGDTGGAPTTSLPVQSPNSTDGWVANFPNGVKFVGWTITGSSVSGTLNETLLLPGESKLTTDTLAFAGTVSGSSLTLTFARAFSGLTVSGQLTGDSLSLSFPQTDGALSTEVFHPGSTNDYNAGVQAVQVSVAQLQNESAANASVAASISASSAAAAAAVAQQQAATQASQQAADQAAQTLYSDVAALPGDSVKLTSVLTTIAGDFCSRRVIGLNGRMVSALIPHHTRLTCDDRYIECPVEA